MHWAAQRRPAVQRITAARWGVHDDVRARQRRYVIAMSVRAICFVLAVVVPGWSKLVFVLAATVLPYLSVVYANGGREPADGAPDTLLDLREHPALPPGSPVPPSQTRP